MTKLWMPVFTTSIPFIHPMRAPVARPPAMETGIGRPNPSSKKPVVIIALTPIEPTARLKWPQARTTIMAKPITVSIARLRVSANRLKGDRKPGARLAIIVESNKMMIARPPTLAARMMNAAKSNLDAWGFNGSSCF